MQLCLEDGRGEEANRVVGSGVVDDDVVGVGAKALHPGVVGGIGQDVGGGEVDEHMRCVVDMEQGGGGGNNSQMLQGVHWKHMVRSMANTEQEYKTATCAQQYMCTTARMQTIRILCTAASLGPLPCSLLCSSPDCCRCVNVGDASSEGRKAAVGQSTIEVMGPGVLAPNT